MNKLFFDHLIEIEKLKEKLGQFELKNEELVELEEQIDEVLQHRVIEVVLDNLSESEHQTFIAWVHSDPGDRKLLEWLKHEIEDVEEHIRSAIQKAEEELLEELFAESN